MKGRAQPRLERQGTTHGGCPTMGRALIGESGH